MIEPKYQILADLLERRLFRVPNYQRPYSWETKQRTDLFSDIESLSHYSNPDRHHFMATVVCLDRKKTEAIGADEYKTLEVVDGQQRLTTLIILIKAITKKIKRDKKLKAELDGLLVKADKRLILLQINHDDNEVFSKYLKHGHLPAPDKIKTQAELNLLNAFNECEYFVDEWLKRKKDLVSLVKLLRHRLGFVFYTLEEEGIVYTIFNALNSRGLDVDWLDKTKSMLMGIVFEKFKKDASREHLETLHGIWTATYKMLGKKTIPGQEILRFAATLKHDKETSKTLSAEDSYYFFQAYCSTDYKKIIETCEWLHNIAEHLNSLYANSRLSAVTDIAHARLLAIAILQAKVSEPDRKELLDFWEKMTFKIFGLYRRDARTGVGDYIRLARDIHRQTLKTKDEILAKMKKISDSQPIDDAVKEITNIDCYNGWENDLKYFFYRYEEDLCDEAKRDISKEVWAQIWSKSAFTSIEHIHPQTLSASWKGKLPGKNGLRNNIHRIGNLVLLPPNENSKIGQKSFIEKK
ncbi:MAG: hypothetical protein A2298_04250, partial [Gammaproteobacteria bacterium RIFOXYB2_FULL_38_6]